MSMWVRLSLRTQEEGERWCLLTHWRYCWLQLRGRVVSPCFLSEILWFCSFLLIPCGGRAEATRGWVWTISFWLSRWLFWEELRSQDRSILTEFSWGRLNFSLEKRRLGSMCPISLLRSIVMYVTFASIETMSIWLWLPKSWRRCALQWKRIATFDQKGYFYTDFPHGSSWPAYRPWRLRRVP